MEKSLTLMEIQDTSVNVEPLISNGANSQRAKKSCMERLCRELLC